WLAKGVTLKDIFLYFMGNEAGGSFSNAPNMLPVSVPIASQLPHAAGIGYAVKVKQLDQVVYAFTGDGGTSEGDFHEALNFAAVWQVPVIFIIQNNQFAISVPLRMQTASESLAIKAQAYGMPGLQVDGNDFFAMLAAVREAEQHTLQGLGPVLIEAVTYRQGAHTTSDDPTKYRSREEEEAWQKKDPVNRLRSYLVDSQLWDPAGEEALIGQYRKEIDRIFVEAENHPSYPLEDVFQYQYAEMPDDLKRQKVEHERFLEWSRARMKKEVAR
ncbi:MAG: thiamine pyrophosphate-dependent enzyme, partial [Bacteroidales bacterium]